MSNFDPVVRLDALTLVTGEQGTGYAYADAPLTERLGLTQLGACYTEVPPGKSACPYHVHRVEDELFIILEGEGEYRFGGTRHPVRAGDLLAAPRGDARHAHKLTNTGTIALKYLSLSSKAQTEVCEYPDSGKLLVRSALEPAEPLRFVGRFDDAQDYWYGEPGA